MFGNREKKMNPNRYISKRLQMRHHEPIPCTGYLFLNTNRNFLAEIFCGLGYKIGAEIGVRNGDYSEILCKTIPGLKLYCVDPWVSGTDDDRRGRWYVRRVSSRLAQYNIQIIRKMSEGALLDVPDNSLDFVYIDAAHDFDNVTFRHY